MATNPVFDRIQNDIDTNEVVVFMKGTPQFPQCGFSSAVVQILDYFQVPFRGVDVLQDPSLREGIKEFSHGRRSPSFTLRGNSSAAATSSAKWRNQAN